MDKISIAEMGKVNGKKKGKIILCTLITLRIATSEYGWLNEHRISTTN